MDSPKRAFPSPAGRPQRGAPRLLAWVTILAASVLGAAAGDVLLGTSPFLFLFAQFAAIPALLLVVARAASRAQAAALRRAAESAPEPAAQPAHAPRQPKSGPWRPDPRAVSGRARSAP